MVVPKPNFNVLLVSRVFIYSRKKIISDKVDCVLLWLSHVCAQICMCEHTHIYLQMHAIYATTHK